MQASLHDIVLAHLLSLRGRVTEDNEDPEHLHDDGTKCKRYSKSQKPQPSYAQTVDCRLAVCWNDKQHHRNVEDDASKHCDDIQFRTAQTNQSGERERERGYNTYMY